MEVAGVVLSAIPICIDILEGCIKAGEHVAAFRQWNMRTEQHRRLLVSRKKDLESLLEALLLGTTELPEDPEMLYQFLKQDWHDEKYVDMLHELNEKHGDLWPDFQALLQDYYEELKHLVVRLGLASAENLDSIGFMLFAGIANSQQQSSNDLLEALKNAPAPRQGMQRFLAGIRFVLRREQSEKSLGGLGQRISELRYRLVHNAEMQVRKRQAKMMSNSAQSSRSRSHLEALYHCLDRTTRSVRKSSPLAMALGLSSSWNAPCDELKKKRYHIALRNSSSWQRTVFHISDAEGKQKLDKIGVLPPPVRDLQPLMSSTSKLVPCLEMHLDLTAQSCLSGPYETWLGKRYTLSDSKANLESVATMIGKGFVLERRLQLAVNIASYVRILFGTPFLDTSCGKDDFGVLTRPGQALGTSPVYLKKELFGQPVPVTTMSTANSQIILLMLGIVLLEVYLDRDSQAYQTGRQPSLQDLQAHLTTWCGQVSDKLPRRFQIAVRKCHLASFASSVFAEQIPQDLDEIVDHMSVLHSNELR